MDTANRAHDEWLALRCAAGAPGAFEDLVSAMERPLLYYAAKLTRDPENALDVLQEVWIKAFRGIRRLKDPASLRPWLYRVTHGIAVDHLRRNGSRERAEEAAIETAPEAADPSFANEDAAAIHAALDALALRHREVLTLFFLEEFSVAEVAEALGCPEGTVKSRLHHAKKALKQILLKRVSRGEYGT